MIGIYFSGTGNTKHCVEKLVKLLDVSAQSFPLEHAPPCSSAANRTRRGLALDTTRHGIRTPEFPWNGSKTPGTTPTPTSRKS